MTRQPVPRGPRQPDARTSPPTDPRAAGAPLRAEDRRGAPGPAPLPGPEDGPEQGTAAGPEESTRAGTDPEIDARALRGCLGCFATGVTVITTRGDGDAPVGLVVNSFASVSLDPPLILWSIDLRAPSLRAFRHRDSFAVNVMGAEDKDLTMQFARPSEDKFGGVDWRPGHDGAPVLARALATIECRTQDRILAGDHEIYIGRVQALTRREGEPLLFHRGTLCTLGAPL